MHFINYKRIFLCGIIICFFFSSYGQIYLVNGEITDSLASIPVSEAEIYNVHGKLLSTSDLDGYFKFYTSEESLDIFVFTPTFAIYKTRINVKDSTFSHILLRPLSVTLSEVEVSEKRKEIFNLEKLNDIVETSIYAGKKTEVILIEPNSTGLALNNARQIYRKVVGLNIYQNDDAGLQLNIGGRGLDPNRTSNFNTRQNGYDISADVLGYPESYYTPPGEALKRIEIVRGAASLQYGTQFGGLINFILKSPSEIEGNRYVVRSTSGSNAPFNNFFSVDGRNKDISYYAFINHKQGEGFRKNSDFKSNNGYIYVKRNLSKKLAVSFEFTSLDYLAQQAGGLNDQMFLEDPLQSNRSRNWFKVNWKLYNLKLNYKPSENNHHTLNIFGLDAERFALGYRSNRVAQSDPMLERDLIKGEFNNIGLEYKRLVQRKIKSIRTANLFGFKVYKSNNKSIQGPGSDGNDPDFNFYDTIFPYYKNQSSYKYPNLNLALFAENIFYLSKKLSITPGIRYEQIETQSDGNYIFVLVDGANNPITDTTIYNTTYNSRDFTLFGLGISYKANKTLECYGNISENYRSVTFADMSIVNPAYIINPNIEDEKGYTADLGIRGNINTQVSYDMNLFYLLYEKRIGFIQKVQSDGNIKSERGNVGDARITGLPFNPVSQNGQGVLGNINNTDIADVRVSADSGNSFINLRNEAGAEKTNGNLSSRNIRGMITYLQAAD